MCRDCSATAINMPSLFRHVQNSKVRASNQMICCWKDPHDYLFQTRLRSRFEVVATCGQYGHRCGSWQTASSIGRTATRRRRQKTLTVNVDPGSLMSAELLARIVGYKRPSTMKHQRDAGLRIAEAGQAAMCCDVLGALGI